MTLPRLAAALMLTLASPAAAEDAQAFIAKLYASMADDSTAGGLMLITGPEDRRRYLTERLAAVFDANDASGEPCIDYAPELGAQDYDGAELNRTLALATGPGTNPGDQVVTATFTIFGEPREIVWSFVAQGDRLLIDDITSGGYSLADLDCTP